jgi:hypothetical protein
MGRAAALIESRIHAKMARQRKRKDVRRVSYRDWITPLFLSGVAGRTNRPHRNREICTTERERERDERGCTASRGTSRVLFAIRETYVPLAMSATLMRQREREKRKKQKRTVLPDGALVCSEVG